MTEIRFGQFALNHARGCLQGSDGAELFLRPKSFLVLKVLVERAGTLVSKDELAQTVWPGVFASDDSVAHCVSDIRKALGPDGAGHIRTVQRRGYMFLPEIAAPPRTATASRSLPRSRWRKAAAAAAALALLAGATQMLSRGSQPTETAAMTRGLLPDASDAAFLRANNLLDDRDWTRRADNEAARAMLERVVAKAPEHAGAWASLGLTYWMEVQHLNWGGGRREMRRALEMVERSIRLDATSRAQRLLAEMRLRAPFAEMRSPLDALAAARAAVALDPQDPDSLAVLAEVLALTGAPEQAVALIERARRLNPNYPAWYGRIAGIAYFYAGLPERAADELRPLYDSERSTHARAWPGWLLAASLAQSGHRDEAAEVVAAALQDAPGTSLATVANALDGFDLARTGPLLDGLRRAGLPG